MDSIPVASVVRDDIESQRLVHAVGVDTRIDASFHQSAVRHAFIRKVYGILALQLFVTAVYVSAFVYTPNVLRFVQSHPSLLWIAMVVSIATILPLTCCTSFARTFPNDVILLSLFTLAEGFLIGVISATYSTDTVMIAMCMTAAIVLGLSAFACQTKHDFTGAGAYMCVLLLTLLGFGLLAALFQSRILEMLYCSGGVLLFGWYIVYDTQLIVGGKHRRHQFTVDDAVFAALSLYLDILNLFLFLLRLLDNRR